MPSRHSNSYCFFPVCPSFKPSSIYTEYYVHHIHLTRHSGFLIIIARFAPEELPPTCRNGAGLHEDTSAHSEYVPIVRGPLDDKYILSLVLKQKKHLILAGGEAIALQAHTFAGKNRVQPSESAQHNSPLPDKRTGTTQICYILKQSLTDEYVATQDCRFLCAAVATWHPQSSAASYLKS